MKLKKIAAGVAAAAMAVSAMTAMSASAISTGVIDFEDGDCSFVYMNDLDGGSKATISVADYNGSKQLKIDPEDCSLMPKIWFDIDSMMERSVAVQIAKVEFDITLVPDKDDGVVTSWACAYVASAGGFDRTGKDIQASQADPKWSQKQNDFPISWNDDGSPAAGAIPLKAERRIMMSNEKYTMTGTNPFMAVMLNLDQSKRTSDYSIYIDNIKYTDGDGKVLTMGVAAAEPAADEATPADDTSAEAPAAEEAAPAPAPVAADDEVVDDDVDEAPAAPVAEAPAATAAEAPAAVEAAPAAPAADTNTAAAATGNVAVASIAAVMAVAGAAAIAAKKRK